MSALETVAVVGVAVWLAVLTFLLAMTVRQVSLVTAFLKQRTPVTNDGLEVGVPVPETSLDLMPKLRAGLGYILFLSGHCQPCREFVGQIERSPDIKELHGTTPVYAAVAGTDSQAREIARLVPNWIEVITDRDAATVTEEFQVQATPGVFEVERGSVTGHAVAGYGVEDFERLLQARPTSDASKFAGVRSATEPMDQSIETTG